MFQWLGLQYKVNIILPPTNPCSFPNHGMLSMESLSGVRRQNSMAKASGYKRVSSPIVILLGSTKQ